jgi:hypothetical protein
MGLSKEVDISRALDTAVTRGVSGDPIMHKLRIALQGGKEKYDGSKKKAVQVLDITHPSTQRLVESFASCAHASTKQPKTQKLQVSRLLNGARGTGSQFGRVPTPQGRPPPRWGGQAAALGQAAAHRSVFSPRAVWTSVRAPPGHTDGDGGTFIPCTQWTDLARFGECGGSLGALGCSYPPP